MEKKKKSHWMKITVHYWNEMIYYIILKIIIYILIYLVKLYTHLLKIEILN
jgi:hypothetical protein